MTSAIGKARPSMIKSLQYKAVTTLCNASLEKNRLRYHYIHNYFLWFLKTREQNIMRVAKSHASATGYTIWIDSLNWTLTMKLPIICFWSDIVTVLMFYLCPISTITTPELPRGFWVLHLLKHIWISSTSRSKFNHNFRSNFKITKDKNKQKSLDGSMPVTWLASCSCWNW